MVAKKISLKCQPRKVLGRKVKTLRREGILPANIYGKKMKSQAVQVATADFQKVFQEAGETKVVNLQVKGKRTSLPILIHNPQLQPVTGEFLHIDFHRVSLEEKVTAMIPLELKGKAPAAESGEGVLITLLSELEVEALPTDLPDKLEVEISKLEKIDDALRVKDIKVDRKKVKILAEENEMVVKIEKPTEEEEKPVEEAVPSEEEEKPEEKVEKEIEEKKAEEKKEVVEKKAPEEKKPTKKT